LDVDRHDLGSNFIVRSLNRFLGRHRVTSEKELQDIINESEERGIINEDEGEMLQSVVEFGDTIVREVIVPRTDMVSCSHDASIREVLDAIINFGHSRIPIFEGTNDRIVGVVYAKDLLRYWGSDAETTNIQQVMRTPYFVPETKKIEDLLQEFRTKRVHMAIVVDEYGGTSGLITIEDLLEEIVGEIQDEYDREPALLVVEEGGSVLVDARLNIEEVEQYFDVEISREKFDTVGGYMFHLLNHVPVQGEKVVEGPLYMEVVDCDERKINSVRIRRDDGPTDTGCEE
jgi:CBS domain containing-hemolysin-like protein